MKIFKSVSANVIKLMDATSVLIDSVHDVCSMAEVITSTALEEQRIESAKDLAKLKIESELA